jgi:hypothetical protein
MRPLKIARENRFICASSATGSVRVEFRSFASTHLSLSAISTVVLWPLSILNSRLAASGQFFILSGLFLVKINYPPQRYLNAKYWFVCHCCSSSDVEIGSLISVEILLRFTVKVASGFLRDGVVCDEIVLSL